MSGGQGRGGVVVWEECGEAGVEGEGGRREGGREGGVSFCWEECGEAGEEGEGGREGGRKG